MPDSLPPLTVLILSRADVPKVEALSGKPVPLFHLVEVDGEVKPVWIRVKIGVALPSDS